MSLPKAKADDEEEEDKGEEEEEKPAKKAAARKPRTKVNKYGFTAEIRSRSHRRRKTRMAKPRISLPVALPLGHPVPRFVQRRSCQVPN